MRSRAFLIGTFALSLTLGTTLTQAAYAKSRALLIAAAEYADPRHRLNAPPNDVALIWKALRQRGVASDDIRVLSGSVPADTPDLVPVGSATRASIIAELERITAATRKGDTVFLFFSGHGSQQPDTDKSDRREADGLDETFLPIDIGKWDDAAETVKNAIIDDEIAAYLKRIRDAGGFVWIVFDSCHSGTMTRSIGQGDRDERIRAIAPQMLGVPQERLDAARAAGGDRRTRALVAATEEEAPLDLGGDPGLVAFFAAQSGEVTYETIFPRDYEADNRRPQSLLSYYLAQALATEKSASYRLIAQRIRAGYDVMRTRAPTPLFEGDLDRPVFGGDAQTAVTWPARKTKSGDMVLDAGEMQGIVRDATVALFAAGKSLSGTPDAQAVVVKSGISQSTLRVLEPAPKRLPRRLIARVTHRPSQTPLTIGLDGMDDGTLRQVRKALDAIAGEKSPELRIVSRDDPADLYLRSAKGHVWVVRSPADPIGDHGEQLAKFPLDRPAGSLRQALAAQFQQAARTRNLLELAARFDAAATARNFTAQAFVLRSNAAGSRSGHRCEALPKGIPPSAEPLDLISVPDLRHCDTLYLVLGNDGKHPVDLTLLFIDSKSWLHPLGSYGKGVRLEPGTKDLVVPLRIATRNPTTGKPTTVGLERLLAVAVERGPSADLSFVVGFGHLASGANPQTRSISKLEPKADAFASLLGRSTRFTPRTRSLDARGDGDENAEGIMRVVRWTTRDD